MPTLLSESPSGTAIPKYARLALELKAQILDGRLVPGDRLPSFSEMRMRWGATPATVERIFASLERDGLIERSQGRGTFVSKKQITQVPERTLIGLTGSAQWIKSRPYWAHLLAGIQSVAQERGLQILILGKKDDDLALAQMQGLRGILFCDPRSEAILDLVQKLNPEVHCVSLLFPLAGMASVCCDDYGASKSATDHLLQLGHRRIACLTGGGDVASSSRRAGYKAALRAAGVKPNEDWVRSVTSPHRAGATFAEMGYETMRDWLRSGWHETGYTAIVNQNDETAIGALSALREHGLKVPRDVSLVGFDGTEAGTFCNPRLTSVALPLEEIGSAGLELLLEGGTGTLVLPSRLIERDSTARPSFAHSSLGILTTKDTS